MDSLVPSALPVSHNITFNGQNIIVIDDDCDDTDIIKEVIKEFSSQHHIHCINKAEEVNLYLDALLDEELPTLLVIDYNMPVLSGKDLILNLNQNKRFTSIPKIIYSATLRPWVIDECMNAGATACYKKGASLQEIRSQVAEMLSFCK